MTIEDGYYSVSEPTYVGAFPIRTDLEVLYGDNLSPAKGWTIGKIVAINGNQYIRELNKYLRKVGKNSEDDLSPEEIELLYSKCEI
jgi:hypothetical protein